MTWLSRLFRKSKQDAQLDSELRFHVEQQTAENVAAGMPAEEARRRALAQFGGLESRKEEARDARGTRFVGTLFQDIRFAFRILRKTPLVTGIALLSLARSTALMWHTQIPELASLIPSSRSDRRDIVVQVIRKILDD